MSLRLNKKLLAQKIAREHDIKITDAENIIQSIADVIVEVCKHEGSVKIPNLGTISGKYRKRRKARNPRTGETVIAHARVVLIIKRENPLLEFTEENDPHQD